MAKTVVGLFEDSRAAQRAVVELIDGGIKREDIGVTSNDYMSVDRSDAGMRDEGIGDKISNFFGSLFGDDEDARYYSDSVQRGDVVVTVDAETDADADRAVAVFDRFGASVDTQGTASRTTTGMTTGTATGATADYAGTTDYADAGGRESRAAAATTEGAELREGGEARLPVMEEELAVGKREVERGGVRVRSRVVERPVEEAVRLREERVRVERRPVNRPVTDEDIRMFREGTIEVTERAEVPVVSKEARVVEEVAISKEVGERTETVSDTVRRTDVEVEEIEPASSKRK
jgi:uncharacterized protein (TIGR02271 family)